MRTRIRTVKGQADLRASGFGDVRKLDMPLAEAIAEMDVHARTLNSLAGPLSLLLELLSKPVAAQNDDLIFSIWTGAVVQYARCFEPSYDKGLEAAEVFPEEWAHQSHLNTLILRSKHLAHDVNAHRFCHVGVEVKADGSLGKIVRPFGQHAPSNEDVAGLLALALRAAAYSTLQRENLTRQLVRELRAKSPEELLALAPLKYEDLNETSIKSSRRNGSRRPEPFE